MMLKKYRLWLGALLLCFSSVISANITTLQYWDPVPFFNAANLNMPADTPFSYGVKRRLLDDLSDKHRRWGINVSPFVQQAIRAQKADNVYFGVYASGDPITLSTGIPGRSMSDFQGTAFLMGLFLGNAPNGNSIWGGPTAVDTGLVTQITNTTVANTQLPINLQDAINALNDNDDEPDHTNAIIYNPITAYNPTILSQAVLATDDTYFGAFSTPLKYQKAGVRWEFNFDFSDHVGFIARGGFCQVTQRVAPVQSLSTESLIYTGLLNAITANGTPPTPAAQSTFNEWVTNNVNELLDPLNGVDYDVETFCESGIEDIQMLAFFRHIFPIEPKNENEYASVILTPYAIIGWTIPIAPVRNYSKLYSLPFGNNSHTSVGGVVGLTFDFIESIEFGFEFGATGFLKKTINSLPMPNHMLQRVIYPWRTDVSYSPGFNGQFSAIFNAYEFAQNTTFSLRYNYVQHNQDTITILSGNPYFLPKQLEEQTPWTSQMFIAALTFEIQPSMFISAAWQGSLSQRNAYCSNTIMGSLNFMF